MQRFPKQSSLSQCSVSAKGDPWGRLSAALRQVRRILGLRPISLLRTTWSEVRSLPRRISFLHSKNLNHVLIFGKMFEAGPNQSLLPNRCTNARIEDTRSLEETLPWTTVVDHFLFLEGWSRDTRTRK